MNKIPVGKTIAYAYDFTLSQLGSIIGLAWISLVAIAVLQFLPYAMGGDPMATATNPLQAGQHAVQNLGITILVLLLYSIIYVALTRLALGQKQGNAIAHFALGVPEFRTFGAIVLLVVVFVGIVLGVLIAGGVGVALLTSLHNEAVTAFAVLIAAVALFCAIMFIALRLGFVLVPVTVVEEHISLSRGWILTQGNFWRILGVVIATTLPLALIEFAVVAVVIGPELFHLLSTAGTGDPQVLSAHMEEIMARHAPVLIGLRLVFAPFQLGLSTGAAVFAYRALATPVQPLTVSINS